MKKIYYFVTVILVLIILKFGGFSPLFAVVISSKDNPVTLTIKQESVAKNSITVNIDQVDVNRIEINGEQFHQFRLGDEPTIGIAGYPDLPFISRTILIPQGAKVALEIENVSMRIEDNINPLIAAKIVDGIAEEVKLNDLLAEHDEFFPSQPVVLGEISVLRGYHLINLRIYPVQINSVTGQTKFNDKIEFSLIYDLINSNHRVVPDKRYASQNAYRAIRNLVENPPPPPERDDVLYSTYLYIVPEVNGVEDAMEPLIEWRRRQGFRVSVEMVENGASAGTINDLIEEYYDSEYPVEYVTLVGDADGAIRLSAASQFGDYNYTRLDGNDRLPDVALGRMSVSSINELNRVVNKLVSYESDPYMDDTDWYRQAASIAGATVNGLGTVLLGKYVRKEMLNHGYDEVHYWYHNERDNIGGDQQFLTDQFDWGISLLHYRAYSRMNNLNINIVRILPGREGRWPAVLAISCNTGNYIPEESFSEAFFRARGGGIGAIGTSTPQTNVKFNNIMSGGVWRGILKDEIYEFGWCLNHGKYALWRNYAGFDGGYMNFMDWNNLIGDSGTHIWTGIPQIMNADHIDEITIGSTDFSIHLELDDGDEPVSDALVCIYKGGELQLTALTDEEGNAGFAIEPELLTVGVMLVTVTKHNHKPYLADIEIVEPDSYIGVIGWEVDDDDEGESSGNDNGTVNPGEVIELSVICQNFGDDVPDGEVTFTLTSISQWVEIPEGRVTIEQAPEVGDAVTLVFLIDIDTSTPDQDPLVFQLNTEVGEAAWTSRLEVIPESPKISVERVSFNGGQFVPGSLRFMDVEIGNIGHSRLESFTATIMPRSRVVRAIRDEANYPSISPDQEESADGNPFRVLANGVTIPGITVKFDLMIESESGFRDTTAFEVVVGEKGEGDPIGPDAYGYICFDSGDEEWDYAPEYDWVEIDPDVDGAEFNGEELNLRDRADNQDVSTVVDLPFEFQYYGEVFDEITICSNGWAAFGDQEELADFRNRRIAQALGPNAQLCVWWDNLLVPNDASITVAYDEDGGRYIIEWNNVGRLLDGGGMGARETFQIVLYDAEVHPTETGDGMILFQYKDVTNQNQAAHNDTPFCTIGIGNLDDSDGIEYTYWSLYPDGAAEIGDEMALLFITQSDFRVGVIEGTIVDEETGEPIPDAEIITSRGFWGETDDDGFYRIDDILLGEDYDIKAFALGWNDSTLSGFDIVPDETLTVDFSLLHPEISFDNVDFNLRQYANEEHIEVLNMANNGNGMLEWSVRRQIRGHDRINEFELREQILAGEEIEDPKLYGAIFTGDHYYVAGRNGRDPQIYVLNRAGELVRQFPQFVDSTFGMRDLAWDGELIWGGVGDQIYGFTTDGELVSQFEAPVNYAWRIAWDSDRELLWISTTTSDIFGVNLEGEVVQELDRQDIRIYGLAYWQDDPDGYPLYIYFYRNGIGDQVLYKMNPDNEDTMFVRSLEPENGGRVGGAFISLEYDPYNWSFLSSINDLRDDRIDIWQLGPMLSWISTEPNEGEVRPEEGIEIELIFNTEHLPSVTYEADLIFSHNAADGESIVSVTVQVLAGAGEEGDRTLDLQEGWNLVSLNIVPDNDDIEVITQNLVEAGILNIVKNGDGQFYVPENEFNNLPPWDYTEGYQINVSEAVELTIEGISVDPREAIALTAGWNMKAFLPRPDIDAVVALSGIVEQLELAKDGLGRFYLPEFDYSNMGSLQEGLGYQYKVSEDVELSYLIPNQLAVYKRGIDVATHFNAVQITDQNMSVLSINKECKQGWELGVFNSRGVLLGSGVFGTDGRCGVAVWGSETVQGEHSNCDQMLYYTLWDGDVELKTQLDPFKGENRWVRDGVLVGNLLLDSAIPAEFGIYAAYPNPFNSQIRLKYGLVEKGIVSLKIYDIAGREVAVLTNRVVEAGTFEVDWKPAGLSSGVYFARLVQAGDVALEKLLLLK